MRKLLIALAFAVGASIVVADSFISRAGTPGTGDLAINNQLIWVYNSSGSAVENGDVVIWKDGTYDGLEVTSTTTENSKLVAGIVYPDTIADASWGSIMVYGYHPAITIDEANAAAACLGSSTTAEATQVTTTAGACVATALEATTSSTTVKGLVHRM